MRDSMEGVVAEEWRSAESRRADKQPLLRKEGYTTECIEDRSLDIHGQPALRPKTGGWRASTIILGVQLFESLAYNGISTNLAVYLSKVLHMDNASIATSITTWTGTCHLTPLLGAVLADSSLGKYRTIMIIGLFYCLGMAIIALSATFSILKPLPCEDNYCPLATKTQKLVFFSGLYLVAIGGGGMKPALPPLGADQFDDMNPIERVNKGSFFNWFYFSINLGAILSSTIVVWIEENIDWGLGFGISTMFMALAMGTFFAGRHFYRLQRPGSPNVLQTDEFRFLSKVEELKVLTRLVPIWFTGIIYSVASAQLNSTFVEQGRAMNSKNGLFTIPPASLFAFEVFIVMLCILIYDKVTKSGYGLTELQRMGLGRFIMILAMSTAAMVETARLKCVRNGLVLSIAWQLPQYFLFGVSEMFNNIGHIEFFYGQAPDAMRSICLAFSLLTMSLGNYMSSLIITVVTYVTTRDGKEGWIPSNLNEGHLDYFFWTLAGLNGLNFVGYVVSAWKYKLKEVKSIYE